MLNISLNLYYIFFSLGVDTTLLANRLGNEKNKRKMRSIPMVIPCIQTNIVKIMYHIYNFYVLVFIAMWWTLQYKHTCALSFCCNMKWFLCLTFNCNCLQHQLVGVAKDRNALLLQYPDYLELWRLGNTRKTSGINHALSHQFLQKSFDFKEFWKTHVSVSR